MQLIWMEYFAPAWRYSPGPNAVAAGWVSRGLLAEGNSGRLLRHPHVDRRLRSSWLAFARRRCDQPADQKPVSPQETWSPTRGVRLAPHRTAENSADRLRGRPTPVRRSDRRYSIR